MVSPHTYFVKLILSNRFALQPLKIGRKPYFIKRIIMIIIMAIIRHLGTGSSLISAMKDLI